MQTFSNLEFVVALTIVAKASGIGPQGQERWMGGFHTRHGCAWREFRSPPCGGFPRTLLESGKLHEVKRFLMPACSNQD